MKLTNVIDDRWLDLETVFAYEMSFRWWLDKKKKIIQWENLRKWKLFVKSLVVVVNEKLEEPSVNLKTLLNLQKHVFWTTPKIIDQEKNQIFKIKS